MTGTPPGIAFFDVDETLISVKSMFDFYDFFLDALGLSPEEQQARSAQARSLLRPGMPREEGNRLFYRRFAGYKVAEVDEIGRAWFDERLRGGILFHQDVLAALRAHRDEGLLTVMVSGSFAPCLVPVAEYAGADVVLSTVLEARDGLYTGEVLRTMIGDAKTEAARAFMAEHGVPADACHAYGDHTSDLGLLRMTGHPVVVGGNPDLAEVAAAHGWRRLPGTIG